MTDHEAHQVKRLVHICFSSRDWCAFFAHCCHVLKVRVDMWGRSWSAADAPLSWQGRLSQRPNELCVYEQAELAKRIPWRQLDIFNCSLMQAEPPLFGMCKSPQRNSGWVTRTPPFSQIRPRQYIKRAKIKQFLKKMGHKDFQKIPTFVLTLFFTGNSSNYSPYPLVSALLPYF